MINHNHDANCCNKEGFSLYSVLTFQAGGIQIKKNIIHDVV